jgi:molybdate transport system substrate-binding protein
LLLALVLFAGIACSTSPAQPAQSTQSPQPETHQPVTLNLSVAASVTDAIKEIDGLYVKDRTWVTLIPNFASSGTLQKQIENGAPADVFISAAAAQMDALQKQGLIIDSSRKNLLMNKVVLIVPLDSKLGLTSFNDLATDKVKQLAIGDPKSVPAGTYAQAAFDQLGITDKIKSKYVIGSDVRQVLNYVETGNVDAGVVYTTDTIVSTKVKIVASAPDEINAKIVYPVAVVKASKYADESNDFISFLFSPSAIASFEKYGFTVITK